MNKKVATIISLMLFVLLPSTSFALVQDTSNVGFIPANIWYSDTPNTQGEKVRIYTVVFNPYQKELKGNVSFYDGEMLLGKKDFVVPTIGTKEVYVEWTVTLGTHKIFARINNLKYLVSKGAYEDITVKEDTSETSAYTVYKPILPSVSDIKDKVEVAKDTVKVPVNNLQQKILESTPDYVSKPIVSTSNFFENWRNAQISVIESKKADVVAELNLITKENTEAEVSSDTTNKSLTQEDATSPQKIGKDFKSSLLTPLKYVELFFITLLSYIIGYKLIFYATLVVIFALFVRLLWGKIFK